MAETLRARIGRMLAAQRRALRLSQAEVALRAGVSVNSVSDIERGAANPTLDLIEKLARVLDWDPATLFSRDRQSISEAVQRELVARTSDLKDRLHALEVRLGDLRPQHGPQPTQAAPVEEER